MPISSDQQVALTSNLEQRYLIRKVAKIANLQHFKFSFSLVADYKCSKSSSFKLLALVDAEIIKGLLLTPPKC